MFHVNQVVIGVYLILTTKCMEDVNNSADPFLGMETRSQTDTFTMDTCSWPESSDAESEWTGEERTIHMYFMRHFHSAWNAKKLQGKDDWIPPINWDQDVGISVNGAKQFTYLARDGVSYLLKDIRNDLLQSRVIPANASKPNENQIMSDFIANHVQIHSSNLKRTMYGAAAVKVWFDLKMRDYNERMLAKHHEPHIYTWVSRPLSCMYSIISNLQETTSGSDAKSEFNECYMNDFRAFEEYLLHGIPADSEHSAYLNNVIRMFTKKINESAHSFKFIDKNVTGIGRRLSLYKVSRSFGAITEERYQEVEQTHKKHVDPSGYAKLLNKLKDEHIKKLVTIGHAHWFKHFITKYGRGSARKYAGKNGTKILNGQILKVRIVFRNEMIVDQIDELWSCDRVQLEDVATLS